MAPDNDIPGFEDDYEDDVEDEEVLFGLEEEAKKKKKKKKKPQDELDELYEQEKEDKDIYANEEFENFNPGVRD